MLLVSKKIVFTFWYVASINFQFLWGYLVQLTLRMKYESAFALFLQFYRSAPKISLTKKPFVTNSPRWIVWRLELTSSPFSPATFFTFSPFWNFLLNFHPSTKRVDFLASFLCQTFATCHWTTKTLKTGWKFLPDGDMLDILCFLVLVLSVPSEIGGWISRSPRGKSVMKSILSQGRNQ